jgi:uncharacterized protein (TIGR02453 family)
VSGAFVGWQGDFQEFFLGLAADNSKRYFEAHREVFEQQVRAPLLALLAELEEEFGPAKLSRPNRDIRFSRDKSPYKTNIYASASAGGYVALDATGLTAAGGRYMMDAAQLSRYREAAASDRTGARLENLVETLRGKGYEVSAAELKRVPPPYPQEHSRGELLRHKRLIYWQRWDVGPWIATTEPQRRVRQVWRDGAELNSWFKSHVDR